MQLMYIIHAWRKYTMITLRPSETLQINFNHAIYYNHDILRRIFLILKDPYQSLVCKFWQQVNSSWETYKLILEMYNQQKFMIRFTLQLPIPVQKENIKQVKQIFASVQALVKANGIGNDVEQARVQEHLGLLDVSPVIKILEEQALIRLFTKLRKIIPAVRDLLNSKDFSLDAKNIRAWMQANSEKLQTVTSLNLSNRSLLCSSSRNWPVDKIERA